MAFGNENIFISLYQILRHEVGYVQPKGLSLQEAVLKVLRTLANKIETVI